MYQLKITSQVKALDLGNVQGPHHHHKVKQVAFSLN